MLMQYFVYSPITSRWIVATPAGAARLHVENGWDVYFGLIAPRRPGITSPHPTPRTRAAVWAHFQAMTFHRPHNRLRASAVFEGIN